MNCSTLASRPAPLRPSSDPAQLPGFCRREGLGVPEESLGIPAPLQPVIAPEIFKRYG